VNAAEWETAVKNNAVEIDALRATFTDETKAVYRSLSAEEYEDILQRLREMQQPEEFERTRGAIDTVRLAAIPENRYDADLDDDEIAELSEHLRAQLIELLDQWPGALDWLLSHQREHTVIVNQLDGIVDDWPSEESAAGLMLARLLAGEIRLQISSKEPSATADLLLRYARCGGPVHLPETVAEFFPAVREAVEDRAWQNLAGQELELVLLDKTRLRFLGSEQISEISRELSVAFELRASEHGSRRSWDLALEDLQKSMDSDDRRAPELAIVAAGYLSARGLDRSQLNDYRGAVADLDAAIKLDVSRQTELLPHLVAARSARESQEWREQQAALNEQHRQQMAEQMVAIERVNHEFQQQVIGELDAQRKSIADALNARQNRDSGGGFGDFLSGIAAVAGTGAFDLSGVVDAETLAGMEGVLAAGEILSGGDPEIAKIRGIMSGVRRSAGSSTQLGTIASSLNQVADRASGVTTRSSLSAQASATPGNNSGEISGYWSSPDRQTVMVLGTAGVGRYVRATRGNGNHLIYIAPFAWRNDPSQSQLSVQNKPGAFWIGSDEAIPTTSGWNASRYSRVSSSQLSIGGTVYTKLSQGEANQVWNRMLAQQNSAQGSGAIERNELSGGLTTARNPMTMNAYSR